MRITPFLDFILIHGERCGYFITTSLERKHWNHFLFIYAEDVEKPDEFPMYDEDQAMDETRKEQKAVEKQLALFEGLKFFLNREVNF